MTTARSTILLRVLLFVVGSVIVALGANIGFGGILTLGLQSSRDFATVADPVTFAVQDNHVRFVGGIWLAVGLTFMVGGIQLKKMQPILLVLIGYIFFAGLCRFSAGNLALLFSPAIAPSLAFELLVFPLIGLWIKRAQV